MLKAVLFDLDGVITDSAKFHYRAWKALADRLDIPFDEVYNEQLKGVSRMESLELILINGNQQNAFTLQEKEQMAEEKNKVYQELIAEMTPEEVLPGIKELLGELKAHGIKTGIASVSRNAFYIINRLGLSDVFDHIVDAAQVERAKPFPDIFLEGAKALGVEAKNCVGIEDAKAGIAAIKAANMYAIGVGTKDQMQGADLILSSTSELSYKLIQDKCKSA